MGGVVGQIVPLVGVSGHLIEFFAAFTIVDVVKVLRTNGMIGANKVGRMGDHCRIRPRSFRVTYQGGNTAAIDPGVLGQTTEFNERGIEIEQAHGAFTGFCFSVAAQFFGYVDDERGAIGFLLSMTALKK